MENYFNISTSNEKNQEKTTTFVKEDSKFLKYLELFKIRYPEIYMLKEKILSISLLIGILLLLVR